MSAVITKSKQPCKIGIITDAPDRVAMMFAEPPPGPILLTPAVAREVARALVAMADLIEAGAVPTQPLGDSGSHVN